MPAKPHKVHVIIGLGILSLVALVPTGGLSPRNQDVPSLRELASAASAAAAVGFDAVFPAELRPIAAADLGPADGLGLTRAASAIGDALASALGHAGLLAPDFVAYAPSKANPFGGGPVFEAPPAIRVDITGVREAIAAYRSGDLAAGDAAAATTTNPLAKTTVEWVALRLLPRLTSFERIDGFLRSHRGWAAVDSLEQRAEGALYGDNRAPALIKAYFAGRAPSTTAGRLALARVAKAEGRDDDASSMVRAVWRNDDFGDTLETKILAEFGSILTRPDHVFRTERLLYEEKNATALRAAVLAGPDMVQLARAFVAVSGGASSDRVLANVPASLHKDPAYLFAHIKLLRHESKFAEAAQAMLAAPRQASELVDGDAWWVERRLIASKLLDLGDAKTAYRLCAENSAVSSAAKVDAEFHAGWIALRFIDDAGDAGKHFAAAAAAAMTPQSIARATYWQGRAADAQQQPLEAKRFYAIAADRSDTYYGQLAGAELGRSAVPVHVPHQIAEGDARNEAVQVVELLEALGQRDLALPLALESAKAMTDEAQLAALADVLAKAQDARATLLVSKAAVDRGFALDDTAFPTFGVPAFAPLRHSAELPIVYAVARQESDFATVALSGAGAKGLMQMITSTARKTALDAGVPFDEARLVNDASFNAQLGAAHLGALLSQQRGSLILTFAAYNAGSQRVKEWIAAYGDPRDLKVDPVDWVERIPIDETRDYVQRVFENLEMYRSRFGDRSPIDVERDMRGQPTQEASAGPG